MAQLPISQFLTTRMQEFDSTFELRSGTGFEYLFFKPLQFITQPMRDEANDIKVAQSFLLILSQEKPDTFDEQSVDALSGNLFVTRRPGAFSSGVARVYYSFAVAREYPAGGASFSSSNGQAFVNSAPFSITEEVMLGQIDGGLYFFDIPVVATDIGAAGTIDAGQLISLAGDDDVVSVTNLVKFSPGADKETNTELITRTKNSIGVRDLVTGKGFRAILFETFSNSLLEAQPIGFGDPEMQRDILFNAHVGGKIDGYVKTSAVQTGLKNFVGLQIDTTRQAFTSINAQMEGLDPTSLNNASIDRSNNLPPIVQEIKVASPARYVTSRDLSSPIDLSVNQYIRIGVDGAFVNVRIAGVNAGATTKNEIVALINNAAGKTIAFNFGNFIRFQSQTAGLASQIVLDNPTVGTSALNAAFGLNQSSAPFIFNGDGPVTYLEGIHYSVDDVDGFITRILGSIVLTSRSSGVTTNHSTTFTDATSNVFLNVQARDVITIVIGSQAGDYRVIEKIDNNTLVLDTALTATASGVQYSIRRTGIKDGEFVYVQYYFNPLSIDIGGLVKLDSTGRTRGIRIGRDDWTITDTAFLRITSVQLIDAITLEPTGEILNGQGGYGRGGYGQGTYGIGAGEDYRLIVNSPTERFSVFEDAFILINSSFNGLSVQVNYEFVPEILSYHNFVRQDDQRVLDGDILMKHFLPVYVSGNINYSVNNTDTSIPDNDTLNQMVIDFITKKASAKSLDYSEVIQFIVRATDPNDKYTTFVQPFTFIGEIHNTDGSITKITGTSQLVVPSDTIPVQTNTPLSPRITHWIADQIVLTRL